MMQKMMSPVVDAASSQQQSQPVAPEGQEYLFTLTFPAGEIAILNVKHAPDQESARAIACTAWHSCTYTVTDGDVTNGHAGYFYAWVMKDEEAQR